MEYERIVINVMLLLFMSGVCGVFLCLGSVLCLVVFFMAAPYHEMLVCQ